MMAKIKNTSVSKDTEGGVVRAKDEVTKSKHYYDTLEPDMKRFIDRYEQQTGKPLILTSGRRQASDGVGKYSKVSHHNTGNAFDIKGLHTDDYYYLMNTKEGLSLMSEFGLGIIDETDPEMLKKTGGTGAHFHIGRDSKYVNQVRERLSTLSRGGTLSNMYSYKGWIDAGNEVSTFQRHFAGDGHEHAHDEVFNATTTQSAPATHEWTEYVFNLWDTKEVEKAIIKESKLEEDEDRKKLSSAQKIVNEKTRQATDFLRAYSQYQSNTHLDPLSRIEAQNPQQSIQGYAYENVSLQDYNPNRFIYTLTQ